MRRTHIITLVITAALVIPALALGATGGPHPGKWTIPGGGGFSVSPDQKSISGLHLSGKECELGNISVLGKLPLHSGSEGGQSSFLIGFLDPSRKNPNDISGVIPQKVVISSGGKKMSARIDLVFAVGGFTRDNDGVLVVNGCDLEFHAHA